MGPRMHAHDRHDRWLPCIVPEAAHACANVHASRIVYTQPNPRAPRRAARPCARGSRPVSHVGAQLQKCSPGETYLQKRTHPASAALPSTHPTTTFRFGKRGVRPPPVRRDQAHTRHLSFAIAP